MKKISPMLGLVILLLAAPSPVNAGFTKACRGELCYEPTPPKVTPLPAFDSQAERNLLNGNGENRAGPIPEESGEDQGSQSHSDGDSDRDR